MNLSRRLSSCLAFLLLSLGQGQAINLVFTPTQLTINPTRGLTSATSVQNRDTIPVEFTAQVMSWTQQDGKDILELTPEALVNPPRFVLAPGQTQTVRVGLRARGSLPQATYRVVLTGTPALSSSAPPATAAVSATITTRYAFNLPLFVTAPGAVARLRPHLEQTPAGLTLHWTNDGTAAASIRNSSLIYGDKKIAPGGSYVLAGSTVVLPLSLLSYPPEGLSITYTDQGREKRELLSPPAR